jgi:hypothetical protein
MRPAAVASTAVDKEVRMETMAIPRYERPALVWPDDLGQQSPIVWWVVFVGFAYFVAVAYATFCTATGGHPDVSLTWHGFKVECRS